MSTNTKIEWAHHTGNLWWGCQEVSPGCDNCFARAWDKRCGGDHWGVEQPRRAIKSVWSDFNKWQRNAAEAGEIHRVFVGSMMDIFEKSKPLEFPMFFPGVKGGKLAGVEASNTAFLRYYFFREVVPACPNLLFLLLTKRPGNILKMIPDKWKEDPPANVMYGCSPVDQETANRDIAKLIQVPGRRFLSIEPLLGPLDLFARPDEYRRCAWCHDTSECDGYCMTHDTRTFGWLGNVRQRRIDWVITGCESGTKRRPFDLEWPRNILAACREADVPYFGKQMLIDGRVSHDMSEWPEDLRVREFPQPKGVLEVAR